MSWYIITILKDPFDRPDNPDPSLLLSPVLLEVAPVAALVMETQETGDTIGHSLTVC